MISTLKGNISLLDFDLIVDPTNQQVSAQIFHQSGNEMMKACQALNGLEVGKAKMTESFSILNTIANNMAMMINICFCNFVMKLFYHKIEKRHH